MAQENIFKKIQRIIEIKCDQSDCSNHTFLQNETINTILTYSKETETIDVQYICEKRLNTNKMMDTIRFGIEYKEEGKNQVDFTDYKCTLNNLHKCNRAFSWFCKECNLLYCNQCKKGHEKHQSIGIEQYNDDNPYSEPKDLQETLNKFQEELKSIKQIYEDQKTSIQEQCKSKEPQLSFPEPEKTKFIVSQDQNISDLRAEIDKNKAYLRFIKDAESNIESYEKQKDNLNDSDVLQGNENNLFHIVEHNTALIDQINGNEINPQNIFLPKFTLHIGYQQILDDLKKNKYVEIVPITMEQKTI